MTIFSAATNCSVVPDAVQTDAGVAGAGVSHSICDDGDCTDSITDLALIHHHQLHFLAPECYYHPAWPAQIDLCASMP